MVRRWMSEPGIFASGLRGPEGPAFDQAGNLYVTELEGGAVQRIAPDGTVSAFVRTGGRPNGSAFHRNGDLYIADASLGAVFRVPPDGRPYMFADAGEEPFRNPNDLAFDRQGGLYLTDPVMNGGDPDGRVHYVEPDGDIRLFAEGLRFPNGVALTPDGDRLMVAETRTGAIHEFILDAPGSYAQRRVRVELEHGPERGGPDGMAFTEDGFLYVAIARFGAVVVIDPDDNLVERIEPGGGFPTNVAFGGSERRTLFITEIETGTVRRLETTRRGALLYGQQGATA